MIRRHAVPALDALLSPGQFVDLEGSDKHSVLRELVAVMGGLSGMPSKAVLLKAILDREELRPTGIGESVAIPHCKSQKVRSFGVVIGRTRVPIEYGAPDGEPVRVLAMIAAPTDLQAEYLRLLSTVTRFLRNEKQAIIEASDLSELRARATGY